MKKLIITTRVILGLPFLVFGVNHFFPFIPHPEMSGPAMDYMVGLSKTGYFWPFLRSLEILIGLSLLSNRFVPLALAVLAPINLQIFIFHLFLEPTNLPLAIILIAAQSFLTIQYWAYFKQLFTKVAITKV